MFTKLGRDEMLMVHYKCCCFSARSVQTTVGIKCSWSGICIKMFWPYLPRGGSRARQNKSRGPLLQTTSSSDRKATATHWIHSNDLEACVMKCCCFLFHSIVKFLTLESSSSYSGERSVPLGALVRNGFSTV